MSPSDSYEIAHVFEMKPNLANALMMIRVPTYIVDLDSPRNFVRVGVKCTRQWCSLLPMKEFFIIGQVLLEITFYKQKT